MITVLIQLIKWEVIVNEARHARWAVSDANVRTRATVQVFRFLTGDIARIPTTAVEVYAELVDHFVRKLDVI